MIRLSRSIVIVIFMSLVTACATSPTGRRQLMLVSENHAISASQQQYLATVDQLNTEGKIIIGTPLNDRIDEITERLVAQAVEMRPSSKDWRWSIEVIDDPEMVNAWCMAGGRMAIYTGLINKIDPSDDEIAQVMGHEISHALANHTAERMSVAMASSALVIGAGIASDSPGVAMAGAAGAAAVAITLPNSRASETEADVIGIELAAKAGYDPEAAVTLWQKMGEVGGGGKTPQFLSTHPAPDNRQEKLAALVPQMMPYYEDPSPRPTWPLNDTLAEIAVLREKRDEQTATGG